MLEFFKQFKTVYSRHPLVTEHETRSQWRVSWSKAKFAMEIPIHFAFPKDNYHRYWVRAFAQAIHACALSKLAGGLWRNDTCLGPSSDWFLVYMFQSYTLLKSWVKAAGVLIFKDLFSPPACIASLSAVEILHAFGLQSVTDFRSLTHVYIDWYLPLSRPIPTEMSLSQIEAHEYGSACHSEDMPAQLLLEAQASQEHDVCILCL